MNRRRADAAVMVAAAVLGAFAVMFAAALCAFAAGAR